MNGLDFTATQSTDFDSSPYKFSSYIPTKHLYLNARKSNGGSIVNSTGNCIYPLIFYIVTAFIIRFATM